MQWLLEAILGYISFIFTVSDSIMAEELDRWYLHISSDYITIKS